MKKITTNIPDVFILEPTVFGDDRGFFMESFNLYKATDYYAPKYERCIRWDDPELTIDWLCQCVPVLSQKDAAAPYLSSAQVYKNI